jgi:uncharacterized protein (DUF2141 family)
LLPGIETSVEHRTRKGRTLLCKRAVFAILFLIAAALCGALELEVRLTVSGVKPGGGTVYAAVFDSAEGYRKNVPFRTLAIQASAETIRAGLPLPPGEYVFSLYQDRNSNGKLDTNFIGIPTEPVGISNYDGKGPPGGFQKHKIHIDASSLGIEIRLSEILQRTEASPSGPDRFIIG